MNLKVMQESNELRFFLPTEVFLHAIPPFWVLFLGPLIARFIDFQIFHCTAIFIFFSGRSLPPVLPYGLILHFWSLRSAFPTQLLSTRHHDNVTVSGLGFEKKKKTILHHGCSIVCYKWMGLDGIFITKKALHTS